MILAPPVDGNGMCANALLSWDLINIPFVLEASGRETCFQLFSFLNAAFFRVHGDEVMYYYVIF